MPAISGSRASAYSRPAHRSRLQGPDVEQGGGGGGGTAPTAPSDVTLAVPASKITGWGGVGNTYADPSQYATWATWGFVGHATMRMQLQGYGSSSAFKGTTAAGDANNGIYALQRAFEGLGAPVWNGGATGLGMFKAKQAGVIQRALLGFFVNQMPVNAAGPFGDIFNTTIRTDVATKFGQAAAFVSMMGGTGLALDFEIFGGPGGNGVTNLVGHTAAENWTAYEAYGFAMGTAIWTAFPACEIDFYHWAAEGSYHLNIKNGVSQPLATTNKAGWIMGMMRAMATLAAPGQMRLQDHVFYRPEPLTALKYNTQGRFSELSRALPQATWNHIARRFHVSPFSWAGTPSEPPGSFYTVTQETQPTYTNNQENYRQWGMGGVRFEYFLGSSADNMPGFASSAQYGLYTGHNNYTYPTGRLTALQATTSTSGAYSTTAPTLSAAKSGSGSTRTITGTAAHAFGIRCVEAYVYPSGTHQMAQMTWNQGGGSIATGFDNAFMSYTVGLTGVATGNYAIVTAHSTIGQQKSTVVAL